MSDNAGPSNEPVAVGVIDQFKVSLFAKLPLAFSLGSYGLFQEVCDVDTVIAHNFLEESNWDLEAAIHLYFHVTFSVFHFLNGFN